MRAIYFVMLVIISFVSQGYSDEPGLVKTTHAIHEREDRSGAFRTHCLESHSNYDDPLVAPKQKGATHHHVFFGNPTVDADSSADTLKQTDRTTCDGRILNKSAYWVPAIYDAHGERLKYEDPLIYYKTGYHVPAHTIQIPPDGLQMIAGNAKSTSPQDKQIVKFRCSNWTSEKTWFDDGDPLDHVSYLPECKINNLLEIRIVFPQCWNGKEVTVSDHKSHMAYPFEAKPPLTGTGACPKSHPVAIPEISYNFAIYVTKETGPSSMWRFSSDLKGVIGGSSAHADWINGWDRTTMNKIVNNCLKPARDCEVGLLGDGTRLHPVVVN